MDLIVSIALATVLALLMFFTAVVVIDVTNYLRRKSFEKKLNEDIRELFTYLNEGIEDGDIEINIEDAPQEKETKKSSAKKSSTKKDTAKESPKESPKKGKKEERRRPVKPKRGR